MGKCEECQLCFSIQCPSVSREALTKRGKNSFLSFYGSKWFVVSDVNYKGNYQKSQSNTWITADMK